MRARWAGLGALGVVIVGAAAMLAAPPVWMLDWVSARFPGCLYRVPVRDRVIALTLDDGPDPVTTPLILAELGRHGARATFFLIGERVRGQPGLTHELVAAGHEIGNHLTRDRPSIRLSVEEFGRDLEEAHQVLSAFAPVRWARPGSGWYSRAMIVTMEQHGYRCALGSIYPYDAAIRSPAFSRRHILHNLRPGGIVVLHDGGARGRRTADVLRMLLPELHRRGYRVVTLSELVALGKAMGREDVFSRSRT